MISIAFYTYTILPLFWWLNWWILLYIDFQDKQKKDGKYEKAIHQIFLNYLNHLSWLNSSLIFNHQTSNENIKSLILVLFLFDNSNATSLGRFIIFLFLSSCQKNQTYKQKVYLRIKWQNNSFFILCLVFAEKAFDVLKEKLFIWKNAYRDVHK